LDFSAYFNGQIAATRCFSLAPAGGHTGNAGCWLNQPPAVYYGVRKISSKIAEPAIFRSSALGIEPHRTLAGVRHQ
jgi:hypothetical protein